MKRAIESFAYGTVVVATGTTLADDDEIIVGRESLFEDVDGAVKQPHRVPAKKAPAKKAAPAKLEA